MHFQALTAAGVLTLAQASLLDFNFRPRNIDPRITPGRPVGSNLPELGFGTWKISNDSAGADDIARAILMGYRHLDGATAYQNQWAVGEGIRRALRADRNIKREDLWVTTKLWTNRHKDPEGGIRVNEQTSQLGLKYVDLTLVHFPVGNTQRNGKSHPEYDFVEMWQKMERLVGPNKPTRHIGISNFNITQIEELLRVARIKPFVHQIEAHPYLQDWKFVEFHQRHGIPLTAYAPLGNTNPEYHFRNWKSSGRLMLQDKTLNTIAARRRCTPAQVALAWNWNRGITPIVKAANPVHQLENYEALEKCRLTDEDMNEIRRIDDNGRQGRRYWDMCCVMNLPCYLGLQDGPTLPAPADYCEQKWAPQTYNKERTDLWRTPRQVCERPVPM